MYDLSKDASVQIKRKGIRPPQAIAKDNNMVGTNMQQCERRTIVMRLLLCLEFMETM